MLEWFRGRAGGEHAVEAFGLGDCAREAVEDEAMLVSIETGEETRMLD